MPDKTIKEIVHPSLQTPNGAHPYNKEKTKSVKYLNTSTQIKSDYNNVFCHNSKNNVLLCKSCELCLSVTKVKVISLHDGKKGLEFTVI